VEHGHFQPVEHLGGVLWLHVLIHRDDALEAGGVLLRLLPRRGRDLCLGRLHFLDAPLDALFGEFRFHARAAPVPGAAPAAVPGWRAPTAIPIAGSGRETPRRRRASARRWRERPASALPFSLPS